MNNPFEEIFKRLENIEKMISPVVGAQPKGRDGKEPVLVRISVASWKIHSPLPPSVHFKVIPQIHSKVPP